MKLVKLFEMQKVLDARIEKEHPRVEGEGRLGKKILALQVELGECANEWRGFKFWSTDQGPRLNKRIKCPSCNGNGYHDGFNTCLDCDNPRGGVKTVYPLLEEYVDCLHFILSIGLECELPLSQFAYLGSEVNETIVEQFIMLNVVLTETFYTPKEHIAPEYRQLIELFIGLGESLGFTWDQIEQAYFDKNATNHTRQDSGY